MSARAGETEAHDIAAAELHHLLRPERFGPTVADQQSLGALSRMPAEHTVGRVRVAVAEQGQRRSWRA